MVRIESPHLLTNSSISTQSAAVDLSVDIDMSEASLPTHEEKSSPTTQMALVRSIPKATATLQTSEPISNAKEHPAEGGVGQEREIYPMNTYHREAIPFVPGVSSPIWQIPGAMDGIGGNAQTSKELPKGVSPTVASKVLRDALYAHDKSIGIDIPQAGNAATWAADLVRESNLPAICKGTFIVRVGSNGRVTHVDVGRITSGDVASWQRVAAALLKKLQQSSLVFQGIGKGASIFIDIDSATQLPSGAKPRSGIDAINIDDPVAAYVTELRRLEAESHVVNEPPLIAVPKSEQNTKEKRAPSIPIGAKIHTSAGTVTVTPLGVGIGIDPVDVGAHLQRVVQTRFRVVHDE